ncbi:hypothetical protein PMKS-000514 [Pichia membranifaciens]|uniref:Peroxin/Ferlin domain-containing protein n=1 Tax=Pichia membranifaciens TaxID=4926 RepID=A0A1Q2YCC3_9ASCO|nr:hypothetical protein PMKS-000514 [Pichia membranifaciens]
MSDEESDPISPVESLDERLRPFDLSNSNSDYDEDDDNDDVSNLTQAELTSQISNISTLSHDRRNRIERSVTHYENMDKGITRMPQFYEADEFLKCLSQFTMENETLKDLGKMKESSDPNGKFVKYEIIIENQRGATLFGSKMFCKQSVLYPLDPPKYQALTGQNLTSLSMYPEPGNNWRWCWKKWHVIMIKDVDEEGWIYSTIRFGSYNWTGVGKFGNFVRRRIWVRMVERVHTEDKGDSDSEEEQETIEVSPNFKDYLKTGDDVKRFSQKVKSNMISGYTNKEKQKPEVEKLDNRNKPTFDESKNKINGEIESDNDVSSETDSDDSQSIVSFSRDTIAGANLSPEISSINSGSPSMHSLDEASEDQKLVRDTLTQIRNCPIDRQKITTLLESFFSYEIDTVNYLLQNYNDTSDKSDSWIQMFISQLHFHDSGRLFVKKFKILIDASDLSTQQRDSLRKLYLICMHIVSTQSYNSEGNL